MLFKRIFFILTILLLYKCTLSAQTGAFTIPYRSAARDSAGTFQPDLRYFKQGGNSFGVLGTIGTIDAQDLQFNTLNLSRLYITSGGNIGINTISPQYKLDINGSINSTQLVTNGYNQFLTSPTTYFGGNTLSFNTVGNKLTQDEDFANGFNGLISYNNAGGGALNIYRINTAITNNPIPNSSGYYLKIQVDNSSFGTNPGWGGFEAYPSNLTLNRMYLHFT